MITPLPVLSPPKVPKEFNDLKQSNTISLITDRSDEPAKRDFRAQFVNVFSAGSPDIIESRINIAEAMHALGVIYRTL